MLSFMTQSHVYFGKEHQPEWAAIPASVNALNVHANNFLGPLGKTSESGMASVGNMASEENYGEAGHISLERDVPGDIGEIPGRPSGGYKTARGSVDPPKTNYLSYSDTATRDEHHHFGTPTVAHMPYFAEEQYTAVEEDDMYSGEGMPHYKTDSETSKAQLYRGLRDDAKEVEAFPPPPGMPARSGASVVDRAAYRTGDIPRSHTPDIRNLRIRNEDAQSEVAVGRGMSARGAHQTDSIHTLIGDVGDKRGIALGRAQTKVFTHSGDSGNAVVDLPYVEVHPSYQRMGLSHQFMKHIDASVRSEHGVRDVHKTSSTGFTGQGANALRKPGYMTNVDPSTLANDLGWRGR